MDYEMKYNHFWEKYFSCFFKTEVVLVIFPRFSSNNNHRKNILLQRVKLNSIFTTKMEQKAPEKSYNTAILMVGKHIIGSLESLIRQQILAHIKLPN